MSLHIKSEVITSGLNYAVNNYVLNIRNPNIVDEKGNTLLHIAVSKGNLEDVKSLLADSRITEDTINATNDQGITALSIACTGGHIDIVKALLADERTTDVDSILDIPHQDNTTITALDWAISKNHIDVIIAFLENPSTKDDEFSKGIYHIFSSDRTDVMLTLLRNRRALAFFNNDETLILFHSRMNRKVFNSYMFYKRNLQLIPPPVFLKNEYKSFTSSLFNLATLACLENKIPIYDPLKEIGIVDDPEKNEIKNNDLLSRIKEISELTGLPVKKKADE